MNTCISQGIFGVVSGSEISFNTLMHRYIHNEAIFRPLVLWTCSSSFMFLSRPLMHDRLLQHSVTLSLPDRIGYPN